MDSSRIDLEISRSVRPRSDQTTWDILITTKLDPITFLESGAPPHNVQDEAGALAATHRFQQARALSDATGTTQQQQAAPKAVDTAPLANDGSALSKTSAHPQHRASSPSPPRVQPSQPVVQAKQRASPPAAAASLSPFVVAVAELPTLTTKLAEAIASQFPLPHDRLDVNARFAAGYPDSDQLHEAVERAVGPLGYVAGQSDEKGSGIFISNAIADRLSGRISQLLSAVRNLKWPGHVVDASIIHLEEVGEWVTRRRYKLGDSLSTSSSSSLVGHPATAVSTLSSATAVSTPSSPPQSISHGHRLLPSPPTTDPAPPHPSSLVSHHGDSPPMRHYKSITSTSMVSDNVTPSPGPEKSRVIETRVLSDGRRVETVEVERWEYVGANDESTIIGDTSRLLANSSVVTASTSLSSTLSNDSSLNPTDEASLTYGVGLGLTVHDESPNEYAVSSLVPGGPAEASGNINIGDILVTVNGTSVGAMDDAALLRHLRGRDSSPITIELNRGGRSFVVSIPRVPIRTDAGVLVAKEDTTTAAVQSRTANALALSGAHRGILRNQSGSTAKSPGKSIRFSGTALHMEYEKPSPAGGSAGGPATSMSSSKKPNGRALTFEADVPSMPPATTRIVSLESVPLHPVNNTLAHDGRMFM